MQRVGFWKELLANASATYSLQQRYYWLTTCVGLLAVCLAIGVMLQLAELFASLLGVTIDKPMRESSSSPLWALLFFSSMPLVFYSSMVVVAYLCSRPMVWFKIMEPSEVKYYALRSRYPARCFK